MNAAQAAPEEVRDKYDIQELRQILMDYRKESGSALAGEILDHFESYLPSFRKIVPLAYQKMMTAVGRYEEQGISHEHALMEAFQEITGRKSRER